MDELRSSINIFVPAADEVIGVHRRRFTPAGARGFPAHISVLHPFLPATALDDAVLAQLAEICVRVPAFEFTLARTPWFGEQLLYLALEPEAPFRALTAAIWAAFPDHPPYEGLHPDGIPHVSVAMTSSRSELQEVESAVQQQLPIATAVREVHVTVARDEPPAFEVVAVLPLGGGDGQ